MRVPFPNRRSNRRIERIAALCLVVVVLLGVWALFIEPRRLVVNYTDIALARWPRNAPPLRVALLSDLHVGSPHWSTSRIGELVARTNAEKPDIVLLAGDYIIDGVVGGTKVDHEAIAEAISGLHAPAGVVAVLGNHDWWNDGQQMRRALESQGIIVLENETHTFVHHGRQYAIAGLADAMTRQPEPAQTLARSPKDVPVIALVHEPDVFRSIDDGAAITLAGHTHGGQVNLPLVGRLVVPSAFGERYAAGHVVEDGRHLFVTTGVGTSILPVRFGVPPEIAILTLRSAP